MRYATHEQASIAARVKATATHPLTLKAATTLHKKVEAMFEFAHKHGVLLHLKMRFPPVKP
jgi:hypothetical protein